MSIGGGESLFKSERVVWSVMSASSELKQYISIFVCSLHILVPWVMADCRMAFEMQS